MPQKKYHYIYKTTNTITGRFYIGMHSTNNLNDGYVGSGKRLWYSLNKYGKENHICEILEYHPNREMLGQRESEIVNEQLLQDPMCMNLTCGGNGGFDIVNKLGKNIYGTNGQSGHGLENLLWGDELKAHLVENGKWELYVTNISLGVQAHYRNGGTGSFLGKQHTEEAKQKMVKAHKLNNHQKGENNSQYGTCWIYSLNEKRSIKIKKYELSNYINNGWYKGRKLKFD